MRWTAYPLRPDTPSQGLSLEQLFADSDKNIGQIPVLFDLAGSVGLSKQDARDVIENRTFKDMVDQDWSRSLQVDPEYIPSLMTNGNLLVNPQRYELFEQFMKTNHVMKRP